MLHSYFYYFSPGIPGLNGRDGIDGLRGEIGPQGSPGRKVRNDLWILKEKEMNKSINDIILFYRFFITFKGDRGAKGEPGFIQKVDFNSTHIVLMGPPGPPGPKVI